MLVVFLLVKFRGKFIVEVVHLLLVFNLVGLETLVDFLALIDRVLLVVLYFLVDVTESLLKEPFSLVPEPHHLVELLVDLLYLVVETPHLQVLLLGRIVHFYSN